MRSGHTAYLCHAAHSRWLPAAMQGEAQAAALVRRGRACCRSADLYQRAARKLPPGTPKRVVFNEALRAFARGCLGVLRNADTMARVGGEEFCVAVRGADLAATMGIAEKLRATVEQLIVELGPGRFARITASFGVANSSEHGTDRMRLLKTADRALYAAKNGGRNAVVAADGGSRPGNAPGPAAPPAPAPAPVERSLPHAARG